MLEQQLALFPLAMVKPIGRPTPDQIELLDLIALRDGAYLGEIPNKQRMVLRNLLAKGYAQCIALGPAVYVLTPIGRIARKRK